jgi:outer membrane protein with beta-barrel domain
MKYRIATVAILIGLAGSSHAFAQSRESSSSGPGRVEATIIPGGATFFTESKDANGPSFGNYGLGGSVTVNANRYVGVEGEVSGALGVQQRFNFNGSTLNDVRTPHLLNYSGNVIVNAARGPVVPYVTGGIGGQTLFEQAALGINGAETFLTGNLGAGVKWYSGRWGLRGDYRFIAVQGKDDAPAFWGQDPRYGHRVYAGIVLNVVR